MAQGKPWPSGAEIVRTKDTSLFHLRVWLSLPEDTPPARVAVKETKTVVAGCECSAFHWYMYGSKITLILKDPVLEGAAKVTTHMVLLDKTGLPAPSMRTMTAPEQGFYRLTAAWDDVRANCVVDNYFLVLCSVEIDWTPPASSVLDLGHDLAMMSDKHELTDVSFDVSGQNFSAHRLVLATRSPVFRAELYGPMAESKMASITVQDMEASTFKSMLHYMYHGSLSDVSVKDDVCSTMAQYQHLLVAADRYDVEGLKEICEEKLSRNGITIDNVVSMLELAEDHACPKLKASCFDFLADGDNFMMVATSGEYIRLVQSFPNLLDQLQNGIKIAREKSGMLEPRAQKKARLC